MALSHSLPLACLACGLEALVGYPDALFRAVGHPVTWMGALIGWLDARLNRAGDAFGVRRGAGILALVVLLVVVASLCLPLDLLLGRSLPGFALLVLLAASLPAQRSLDAHVRAVAEALETGGLPAGRRAVSRIVGRNVEVLDEAGVSRAAIESLAENFSDGIVAPVLWTALLGLTGGALYKAVNTADSMIGHKSERHLAFGWAAARFDDLVNLPASRLAALWILLAAPLVGASAGGAWRAVWRDARHHRSPNAGWPEAAVAGALDLALAGPRVYGTQRVEDGTMGDGRREATAADIRRALALVRCACLVEFLALGAAALMLRG